MTPILHVRKNVLGVTQAEMAVIAAVSQGTISKWEAGELQPDLDKLALIREEAQRRGIEWDDRLFFESPLSPQDNDPAPEPERAQ